MGWFSFFGRKDDDLSISKILDKLQESIQLREQHLAAIKLRERRAVVYFTIYSLIFWVVYSALWWFQFLPIYVNQEGYVDPWFRMLKAAPVALLPFAIVFTRRTFRWFYRRQQQREVPHTIDKALKELRTKQKAEVLKLKKRVNYDEMRALIEKYDDAPRRPIAIPPGTPRSGQQTPAGTPIRGANAQNARLVANSPQGTPNRGHISQKSMPANISAAAYPQSPGPPSARGWADRVAEALLGENEQAVASKYALICKKCFNHNGLVLKDELSTTSYICPKCGEFNPAKASAPSPTNLLEDSSVGGALRNSKSTSHLAPDSRLPSQDSQTSRTRTFPAEPTNRRLGTKDAPDRRQSPLNRSEDLESSGSEEEAEVKLAGEGPASSAVKQRRSRAMDTDE